MWELLGTFFHSLDGFTYHVRIMKPNPKYIYKNACVITKANQNKQNVPETMENLM